jgi:putative ABC transport system permease protein
VLLLAALVGALGGLYPALYLSRFQPAAVLKANASSALAQGSPALRNALVVTQFAISIGLIVCTAIIYSQTRFVETIDPGFKREGLIQMEGAYRLSASYDAFKREALRVPGVAAVGVTNLGVAATNRSIVLARAPEQSAPVDVGFYRVDPDFFPTMGMRLLAGRLLDDRRSEDQVLRSTTGATEIAPELLSRGVNVVVNRRAAMQLGYSDPGVAIGRTVKVGMDGDDLVPSTIVGVVEDTRIRTARDEIEPLIFGYDRTRTSLVLFRYSEAVPSEVMAGLRRVWLRFQPDFPFQADFAEDLIAELYARDRARAAMFLGFSIFAIVIACLGCSASPPSRRSGGPRRSASARCSAPGSATSSGS